MLGLVLFSLGLIGKYSGVEGGVAWSWQSPRNAYEEQGEFIGTAPACSGHTIDCVARGLNYWYSVTSGDGHYCSSGVKVYCNAQTSPYANTWWVGTAPVCEGSCGDCNNGATCIALSGSGDGSNCGCFFTCGTSAKAFCATYSSSRRVLASSNSSSSTFNYSRQGVDIGFYLSFGIDFEDEYIFQSSVSNDSSLYIEFGESVIEALDGLITTVDSSSASVSISGSGFETDFYGNWSIIFANYTMVSYINVRIEYDNEDDAQTVEEYLQNSENELGFNDELEIIVAVKYIFGSLDYDIVPYLVEANRYITSINGDSSTCQSSTSDATHYQLTSVLAPILSILAILALYH